VLDLRAAQDAIRVVRQAQAIRNGPPLAVLIPNKLQVQYRLSRELLDAARTVGIPSARGLRLRQAYADAVGQGSVVWRMGPKAADAAGEINNLFEELIADGWRTKAEHEPGIANN
jgi:chromosome partitioning protein